MTMIPENIATALKGSSASDQELSMLRTRLPPKLIPDWLVDLLGKFRLGGASLSLAESDDVSDMGAELKWFTPDQIISEAFESEPGQSVIMRGFLPVAGCAIGSGNPYFLDLTCGAADPPLVRVLHDFVGEEGTVFPSDGFEVVSPNLSDFFSKATVN